MRLVVGACALGIVFAACGQATKSGLGDGDDSAVPEGDASSDDGGSSLPDDDAGGGGLFHPVPSDASDTVALTSDGSVVLPSNFVPTELGGYALGPAITNGASDAGVVQNSGTANCSLVTGVVRDFMDQDDNGGTGDPDFNTFSGSVPTTGLVQKMLGADLKPVYAGNCGPGTTIFTAGCLQGQMLTTKANFDEWYRYAPGVNKPFLVYLEFVANSGVYTFDSESYYPLDNAGWGNNAKGDDGKQHNFGFTTEVHLAFTYKGGETFTFKGDDDVWAFINEQLAVDLGGTHSAATGSVMLDSLGLTKGKTYALDIFNAERHPDASHFRVDTNLSFTSCGTVPPDVPPK